MNSIISEANKINQINNNRYFKLLDNQDLEHFILSKIDFYLAVNEWPIILQLMMNSVPTQSGRHVLLQNINDELGRDNIALSHKNTFKKFIDDLNTKITKSINSGTKNEKYVLDFNRKLEQMVENRNWLFSIAALGMIEYTYVTISTRIHDYTKQYIPADEISHYSTHEVLDMEHATELFSVVEPYYESHKDIINGGLNYGYRIFDELYAKLSGEFS